MKTKTAPIETLRELLSCDFNTGALTWRERPISYFTSPVKHRDWTEKHLGKPALTSAGPRGFYRTGRVAGMYLMAHRVIWAMAYGEWPDGEIDHINGDTHDNRLVNLRVVTDAENKKNRALSKNSAAGALGVCWCKGKQKWQAQIQVNRKLIYLGLFPNKEAAIAARKSAEIKYGFHPNHGRLAA